MVVSSHVHASGVRGKLQKVQRICEDSGEAVPTFLFEIFEMACDGIEAKPKNALLAQCNTETQAKLRRTA